jgi:hypothetical protein
MSMTVTSHAISNRTHFAQIRRYYQSIAPTFGAGPRQHDPSGKQHGRNGRKCKTADI